MMKIKHAVAGGVLALAAALPVAADNVEVGVLTCESVAGSRVNLLIRSTTDVLCEFKDSSGKVEKYKGESGIAFGLDLSFKDNESFAFSVVSAGSAPGGSHQLAGKYLGGKATASVGVGLGAAALVGGSNDQFGLNPLAVSTEQGVGASAGIGFLYIEPAN